MRCRVFGLSSPTDRMTSLTGVGSNPVPSRRTLAPPRRKIVPRSTYSNWVTKRVIGQDPEWERDLRLMDRRSNPEVRGRPRAITADNLVLVMSDGTPETWTRAPADWSEAPIDNSGRGNLDNLLAGFRCEASVPGTHRRCIGT